MAYEFTKLNAVESIEELSASANILVEENGIIKKVSKNLIGGNVSNVTNDYDIIVITNPEELEQYSFTPQTIFQSTYEEVLNKMANFKYPKVLLIISDPDYTSYIESTDCAKLYDCIRFCFYEMYQGIFLYSDDAVVLKPIVE